MTFSFTAPLRLSLTRLLGSLAAVLLILALLVLVPLLWKVEDFQQGLRMLNLRQGAVVPPTTPAAMRLPASRDGVLEFQEVIPLQVGRATALLQGRFGDGGKWPLAVVEMDGRVQITDGMGRFATAPQLSIPSTSDPWLYFLNWPPAVLEYGEGSLLLTFEPGVNVLKARDLERGDAWSLNVACGANPQNRGFLRTVRFADGTDGAVLATPDCQEAVVVDARSRQVARLAVAFGEGTLPLTGDLFPSLAGDEIAFFSPTGAFTVHDLNGALLRRGRLALRGLNLSFILAAPGDGTQGRLRAEFQDGHPVFYGWDGLVQEMAADEPCLNIQVYPMNPAPVAFRLEDGRQILAHGDKTVVLNRDGYLQDVAFSSSGEFSGVAGDPSGKRLWVLQSGALTFGSRLLAFRVNASENRMSGWP